MLPKGWIGLTKISGCKIDIKAGDITAIQLTDNGTAIYVFGGFLFIVEEKPIRVFDLITDARDSFLK